MYCVMNTGKYVLVYRFRKIKQATNSPVVRNQELQ